MGKSRVCSNLLISSNVVAGLSFVVCPCLVPVVAPALGFLTPAPRPPCVRCALGAYLEIGRFWTCFQDGLDGRVNLIIGMGNLRSPQSFTATTRAPSHSQKTLLITPRQSTSTYSSTSSGTTSKKGRSRWNIVGRRICWRIL